MMIHYFQHVPFEGPAFIGQWAQDAGVALKKIALYADDPIPSVNACEAVVVMGGPMGANDELMYPWLKREKRFIEDAIEAQKTVIGICLGAQLIASVLGARVYANDQKEIGWFPIRKTPQADGTSLGRGLPERFSAFHWHGDTFDIPAGAVALAESDACRNQAFVFQNRVLGLQFHLEATPSSINALIENCCHELVAAPFVQSTEQICQGNNQAAASNALMAQLLDHLIRPGAKG
jgi:GMP synthase-like glutamine amidotransferase